MITDFGWLTENFGLSTLITAFCVTTISILIELFLSGKIPVLLSNVIPFLSGAAISLVYGLLSKSGQTFSELVSSGFIAGSLGLGFKAFIKKLKSGKLEKDLLVLTVSEIIEKVIESDAENVAAAIASVIRMSVNEEKETVLINVKRCLNDYDIINGAEELSVAIVEATKRLV